MSWPQWAYTSAWCLPRFLPTRAVKRCRLSVQFAKFQYSTLKTLGIWRRNKPAYSVESLNTVVKKKLKRQAGVGKMLVTFWLKLQNEISPSNIKKMKSKYYFVMTKSLMRGWLTFLGGIKTPPRRLDQISIKLPTKSVLNSRGRISPGSTSFPAISEASLKHAWKRRFSRPPKPPHFCMPWKPKALGIKFISGPNLDRSRPRHWIRGLEQLGGSGSTYPF